MRVKVQRCKAALTPINNTSGIHQLNNTQQHLLLSIATSCDMTFFVTSFVVSVQYSNIIDICGAPTKMDFVVYSLIDNNIIKLVICTNDPTCNRLIVLCEF